MKDFKSDATSALSKFAKDKRLRQVRTERVERTVKRDDERRSYDDKPKRSSYNPNFTSDNRLKDRANDGNERRFGDDKPRKSFGSKSFSDRKFEGDKPHKSFGDRKFGDGKFEGDGGRKSYGDRKPGGKKFGDKKFGGERPAYGDKGGRKSGRDERRFDDKPKSYPKYNPNRVTGEIRLNRFVAQSGLCSRREADDFITAGLVSVNGVVVTELGTKVKPTDEVRFNDERIRGEKNVYLILNKPKGYVTTLEDEHANKTVMELVKDACKERIYPVGRLDKNSLGLLLFTNDGDITRQLTHPSNKKKKIYEVELDKPLTRADFDALAEGITLEDGDAFFDEISYLKDDKKSVGVEIHSGRNRIVRRMFEHLGYSVTKLDRVYYAGLTKKNLKRGAWRFLTDDEVNRLKSGRYE
ncbi:MAG: rRNA pseudouridine synthase [Alistipes sp.]|nr:rRNA pseudouridine synthase [Alistipes sp.]